MSQINLPERVEKKLKTNQLLTGIVNTVLFQFGEILKDNKLFFFEEYTDHGREHIENVIFASDHLITKRTFEQVLSEKDVAYYLLAVILHDVGMHLRPEGFEILVSGTYDNTLISSLDTLTWTALWNDYLAEARRFNQRQLLAIFGSKDFVVTIPDLSKPDSLTGSDRKLIGEFIRRHHPRLAHEIAIKGFPGMQNLVFAQGLAQKDRDLIGLIARSHGMDLRKCADQVEKLFGAHGKLVPLGIHAIYHMVLLRVGDYMQIDRSRTSITLLKLRSLISPLSLNEHNAHLAIDNIDDKYQHDYERIFVSASPVDSKMFFKLKNLFSGIQMELDQSWAVLGELYGAHADRPDIRFRRINSNLEDQEYLASLNYVPQKFTFKANEELIRLLIAPLYGDDPTFGVRELLQNAIDACRERDLLETVAVYEPGVSVAIKSTPEAHYFSITDNGIGMDTNVIKEFFLNAGASFRNSPAWEKHFTAENGGSKVRRSGRFGIGALAAFLIGEEISVSTRRFDQTMGYRFNARIDTNQIELKKDATLPAGTTIQIAISKDVYKKMSPTNRSKSGLPRWYQWYTLNRPVVTYHFEEQELPVERPNPDVNEDLAPIWHRAEPKGYEGLLWTYDTHTNPAKFTCNGIIIPQDPNTNGLKLGLLPHLPKLSLFDNAGSLPLTLNRNGYSAKFSFNDDLELEVCKDFIAYLLTFVPRSVIKEKSVDLAKQAFNYPGLLQKFTHDGFSYGTLAYSNNGAYAMAKYPLLGKNGFVLDYSYCIRKIKKAKGLFFNTNESNLFLDGFYIGDYFIKFSSYNLSTLADYKAVIEPKQHSHTAAPAAIMFKKDIYDYLFEQETRRLSKTLKNGAKTFYDADDWVAVDLYLRRQTIISKTFLEQNKNINIIRDYDIQTQADGYAILNKLLSRYLGDDVIIPYNIQERKRKYPLAFKELKSLMIPHLEKVVNPAIIPSIFE